MNIVGEIKGKHCIIVDDMIDTAGTLCKSADSLKDMGALSVSACCTHALFSGPALKVNQIKSNQIQIVVALFGGPAPKDEIKSNQIKSRVLDVQCGLGKRVM
jgi:ribose-phosphate pyrophosphokinase